MANFIPVAERFWSRLERGPACWEWTGTRRESGYGELQTGSRERRKRLAAHRVAWELTHGPIPDGMLVCHTCDNPPCCNPAHLFLGTHGDNMRDKCAKGRGGYNRGEACGKAKLTAADVRVIRTLTGSNRQVAACYGVTHTAIQDIRRGRTWRHV